MTVLSCSSRSCAPRNCCRRSGPSSAKARSRPSTATASRSRPPFASPSTVAPSSRATGCQGSRLARRPGREDVDEGSHDLRREPRGAVCGIHGAKATGHSGPDQGFPLALGRTLQRGRCNVNVRGPERCDSSCFALCSSSNGPTSCGEWRMSAKPEREPSVPVRVHRAHSYSGHRKLTHRDEPDA